MSVPIDLYLDKYNKMLTTVLLCFLHGSALQV